MSSAVLERLRPGGATDAPPDFDRALALVLVRLAALEAKVEALVDRNQPLPKLGTSHPAERLDQLQTACLELGIQISADGFVREYGAARLVNRSPTTLRNWRYAERPLPFRRLGGRIEYALSELASFLESRGEE